MWEKSLLSLLSSSGTIIPLSPLKQDLDGNIPKCRVLWVSEPPVGTPPSIHQPLSRVTLVAVLALLSWPLHQNKRK